MTRQGVANSRSNAHRNRPKLGATVLQRSAECPDTTIICYKISDSLRIRRFCKILKWAGFLQEEDERVQMCAKTRLRYFG